MTRPYLLKRGRDVMFNLPASLPLHTFYTAPTYCTSSSHIPTISLPSVSMTASNGPKASLFRTAKQIMDEENQAPHSVAASSGPSQSKASLPPLDMFCILRVELKLRADRAAES